ncbi:hypothetical protein PhaeoP72_01021 [Phaeobacter inhibens]|uniref:hypothetical protein n=1 Tax=Phaeobacter inhibens TaxID=221822 RepID=UPI000C9C9E51|nr:hypothetical protein [Phaeobacter inhibens]AUR03009.1 hypothetical protein PhaeoP72_01021 [Phaeobacter inhibens]
MITGVSKAMAILALCGGVLAGCDGIVNDRPTYAGVPFKAKAKAVNKKETLGVFTTAVSKAPRSLEGARLAAHHEGTRYCIENFGSSRIAWQINPLDTDVAVPLDGDTAVYGGTCTP